MGFKIINETYRKDRDSYKLDLAINGTYCIELFSFPSPPKRPSRPEACGLRHLAFGVEDLEKSIQILQSKNVITEAVRIDELTGKSFVFFKTQMPYQLNCMRYEIALKTQSPTIY